MDLNPGRCQVMDAHVPRGKEALLGELASSCAYNTMCAEALQLPWMLFNPCVALASHTVVCFTVKYYRAAKY